MTIHENDAALACVERMQSAWNRRDATAYAQEFTEDATNVTFFGDAVFSRTQMEEKLAALLQHIPAGMTMTMKVLNVTKLGDNVRSVVTITGVGTGETYPLDKLQTMTLVEIGGRWMCAAFQNTTMSEATEKFYNPV